MSANSILGQATIDSILLPGTAGELYGQDIYGGTHSMRVARVGDVASPAVGFNFYENNGADYGNVAMASVRLADPGANPFCKIERYNNDGCVIASQSSIDITTANYFTCGGGTCSLTNLATINGSPVIGSAGTVGSVIPGAGGWTPTGGGTNRFTSIPIPGASPTSIISAWVSGATGADVSTNPIFIYAVIPSAGGGGQISVYITNLPAQPATFQISWAVLKL